MQKEKEERQSKQMSETKSVHIDYGTAFIKWQTPEFLEHNRGPVWVGVMSVLAIALIVYGIISDSITFSILIALFAGVFFLTHNHKPRIVEVVITDAGVKFGEKFFPYGEIRTFWIVFDPPHVKTLNLRVNKGIVKEVPIQLGSQNPAEIRALLSTEVPEWKNRTETLSEILIRIFKL